MNVYAVKPRVETAEDIRTIVRDGVRDVKRAAIELGISVPNLRKRISRGQIWTFHIDGKVAVPVSEIRRLLEAYATQEVGLETITTEGL